MSGRVFQLIPGVQSYDWGVPGSSKDCLVARYAEATAPLHFQSEADRPYAELWMGTHPNAPARVVTGDAEPQGGYPTLAKRLCEDKTLIGQQIVDKYGADPERGALPFLFKVLSINKALSIQAHPDKKLAEQLHAQKPNMYKDDNHKPEMAIAIRAFEGFCGFRPVREVLHFLNMVPEYAELLQVDEALVRSLQSAADAQDAAWKNGTEVPAEQVRGALREVFGRLMRAEPEAYKDVVSRLADRYAAAREAKQPTEVPDDVAELVVRLNTQFPQDIGVLCTFVLNVVRLQEGEALFLRADEPHAYLSGHILECMAASDNVVRAGLTPKARDVEVLVSMLTYQSASAADQLLSPVPWDAEQAPGADGRSVSMLYDPPIPEFAVALTTLSGSARKSEQRGVHGPSLVFGVQGNGTLHAGGASHKLVPGLLYYVAADTPVSLEGEMQVARAFLE